MTPPPPSPPSLPPWPAVLASIAGMIAFALAVAWLASWLPRAVSSWRAARAFLREIDAELGPPEEVRRD